MDSSVLVVNSCSYARDNIVKGVKIPTERKRLFFETVLNF